MRFFFLPAALCFTIVACAPRHVIHERRERGSEWLRRDTQIDKRAVLPTISIGLTQQRLESGEQFLMDVSDPASPNYGMHWTPEQVVDTFAPDDETIDAVKSWLIDSGISEDRIRLSNSRSWLRMNLTISEAENLLKTEYQIFEHKTTTKRALAVEEYSVPAHLARHIDYITPILESTPLTRKKPRQNGVPLPTLDQSNIPGEPKKFPVLKDALPGTPPLMIPPTISSRDSGSSQASWDISMCGSYGMSRACIQALYGMPNGTGTSGSLAIIEMQNQAYVSIDLELFLYNFVTQTDYILAPIPLVMTDAIFALAAVSSLSTTLEGELDLQISQGLVYPLDVWWYQVGDLEVFFDAIDASYCSIHAAGPCGTTPLAKVISVSWGWYESPGDTTYIRKCNEFMKLGLMGVTVLFASGDSGVASSASTCNLGDQFKVMESAACPYVTAVGATQLVNEGNLAAGEVAASNSVWSTGGGFSNRWALPSYQASAVSAYYASHAPTYTQYNNSRAVRGYPDISAVGQDIIFVYSETNQLGEGTSAATPIIGSIITLINEARLAAGKSTVGFINPVLYSHPSAMNDITSGSNPGCGTNGFSAVPGWDPVTGLGTPNYQKLLQIWLSLP